MKILLAQNYFHVTGGAEVFGHEVARVLANLGHEVAFICTQSEKNPQTIWGKYFPKAVDYKNGPLISRVLKFKGLVYSQPAKASMRQILNDFRPDIVHCFSIYGGLTPSILDACHSAGVPVVMSCNDYKHICPNYKLYHHGRICEECKGGRFYRAAVNRCCKDSIVISTASSIEAYVHNWLNLYKKNIHTFLFASEFMLNKTNEFWGDATIKSGILKNPFHAPSHEYHGEYEDYFLYFGRLIEEKGVDVLIMAMKKVPEAHLKIVGDGPDGSRLRTMVKDNGIGNVTFLGPLWGDELNTVLFRCRAVIVPSLWHENFPYVILQSFAVGKPVIGTRRGGIPELVKDKQFGLIYDPLDVEELPELLKRLWADPERTTDMGKAAKEWCDLEFNDEAFGKAVMDHYLKVLS
jgi:glycosyltransferase involved in cell wall biosynthesis